jgi:aspartate carbamoyltransferase regulatory subunit
MLIIQIGGIINIHNTNCSVGVQRLVEKFWEHSGIDTSGTQCEFCPRHFEEYGRRESHIRYHLGYKSK